MLFWMKIITVVYAVGITIWLVVNLSLGGFIPRPIWS